MQYFSCCVDRFCRSVDDQLSDRQVYINCKCIAHLVCSELLHFQNPVDINFVVSPKDLTNAAKSRIKAISKSDHDKIHCCILCQAIIKAIKIKKLARKLMPGDPTRVQRMQNSPTKFWLSYASRQHSTPKHMYSYSAKRQKRQLHMD